MGETMQGIPKNVQSTHIGYRAHRAVIFAIARLSCFVSDLGILFASVRGRRLHDAQVDSILNMYQ